jgi:hypothetical protein
VISKLIFVTQLPSRVVKNHASSLYSSAPVAIFSKMTVGIIQHQKMQPHKARDRRKAKELANLRSKEGMLLATNGSSHGTT